MDYTNEQLERMVDSDNVLERIVAAQHCVGLDRLMGDASESVRRAVALQGHRLDILIHDKAWRVREIVAQQGHGLDVLLHDEAWEVRWEVARQGFGLDVLVADPDWHVRMCVAYMEYGLDTLIHDESDSVRTASFLALKKLGGNMVDDLIENAKAKAGNLIGFGGEIERDF